jgi:hypothetical protein
MSGAAPWDHHMHSQHMSPNYPLTEITCAFGFLSDTADLIIIASPFHFGVLLSLDKLPPPTLQIPLPKLHDMLIEATAQLMPELAEEYVGASEENGFPLPLPDPDAIGYEFTCVSLRLTGKVGAGVGNPSLVQDLILDGEYLFITEVDVDISEFFAKTGSSTTTPTVQ